MRRACLPRVASVIDCGRVVSTRTIASQVCRGVVWAIDAAWRDGTGVEPRDGGRLSNIPADDVVQVNADIGEIDVDFINPPDTPINSVGVEGLGEVAMVGAAAATAHAIYFATGKPLRQLSVRIEDPRWSLAKRSSPEPRRGSAGFASSRDLNPQQRGAGAPRCPRTQKGGVGLRGCAPPVVPVPVPVRARACHFFQTKAAMAIMMILRTVSFLSVR